MGMRSLPRRRRGLRGGEQGPPGPLGGCAVGGPCATLPRNRRPPSGSRSPSRTEKPKAMSLPVDRTWSIHSPGFPWTQNITSGGGATTMMDMGTSVFASAIRASLGETPRRYTSTHRVWQPPFRVGNTRGCSRISSTRARTRSLLVLRLSRMRSMESMVFAAGTRMGGGDTTRPPERLKVGAPPMPV